MKLWKKLTLSVIAGILAMTLYAAPMWWGVLFSPLAQPLTTAPAAESVGNAPSWESGGVTLRIKALDLLFSWLGGPQA